MLTQSTRNIKVDKTVKKLNDVYTFLVNNQHSSFYKEKYNRAGISFKKISSINQFKKLPFLTKDEILSAGPYKFLFIPRKRIDHIGITSGTTNQDTPLVLLMNSKGYPQNMFKKRFKEYYKLKINALMLLYPNINAQRRYQINYELIKHNVLMVLGDINNLKLSAKIAKRLQIDAIETTSSILYFFLPFLKKEYDLDKIRLINLGGEFTSEQKLNFFKKVFKNAYFDFNFGGLELSNVGERCEYLRKMAPRFFHPTDHLFVEVLNPEKEGELVLTSLARGKWPFIIRYKTGNSVKIIDFKCPCGKEIAFELFGKIGFDVCKVQGTFIYANHIYQLLGSFFKYLKDPDFRLHVYEVVGKDKIKVKLVLQVVIKDKLDRSKVKDEIARGISDNLFLSSKSTLSDLVNKDVFMPLEVEFVDSMPFNPKQTNIISHLV